MAGDDEHVKADPLESLWARIKRRAPRLAAIMAIMLAVAGLVDWFISGTENVQKVAILFRIRPDPQKELNLLILKGQYPLEPLSAYFDVEYQMTDPELLSYTARLQKGAVADLREKREGRGHTSDDLRDERFVFVVSNFHHNGLNLEPGDVEGEGLVQQALSGDETVLILADTHETKDVLKAPTTIRFACMSASEQDAIVTLPAAGRVQQTIELYADFHRRVFVKHVQCKSLPRLGPNATAKSAIDLIGRRLSWDSTTNGEGNARIIGNLTRIAFVFPFAYAADDHEQKYIQIPKGQTSIVLSAEQLGLKDLLGK